jgi:hypothetical protein
MLQIAILLMDLLAGRASAQLVCDAINALQAFETPANVARLTSLLRELAAKVEPEIAREVHAVAQWFATRPGSEWGPADYGGNIPTPTEGVGTVVTRPEPDQDQGLGGNVPATFGSAPPAEPRPEPEDTRDPGDPGT